MSNRTTADALLIFLVFFTGYTLFVFFASPLMPMTADGHNYLLQAHMFLSGRLSFDAPFSESIMYAHHTVVENGIYYSKYPPGTSLFLTPFVALGIPNVANPFVGAMSLSIMYIGLKRAFSMAFALVTVLLLGLNPYFVGYLGSYFSQPLLLFLVVLWAIAWWRHYFLDCVRSRWLVFFVLWFGFLVRPVDVVCLLAFGGILSAWRVFRNKKRDKLTNEIKWNIVSLAGIVLGATTLGLYYWLICGEFTLSKYREASYMGGILSRDFPESLYHYAVWYFKGFFLRSTENLTVWTIQWSGYLLPVLAFLGLKFSVLDRGVRVSLICIYVVFVAVYNNTPYLGWPLNGARYYYPIFPVCAVLGAGFCMYFANRFSKRNLIISAGILVLLTVAILYSKGSELRARTIYFEALWRDAEESCVGRTYVRYEGEKHPALDLFIARDAYVRLFLPDGTNPYNTFRKGPRFIFPGTIRMPNKEFRQAALPAGINLEEVCNYTPDYRKFEVYGNRVRDHFLFVPFKGEFQTYPYSPGGR